jgi:glycosyltransferase involved in cell wall biosynthesis
MSGCGLQNLRILFITDGSPWPLYLGVNQRTHLLLRALRRCGRVDTVINSRYAEVAEGDRERLRRDYGVVARLTPRDPGEDWPWRLVAPLSARWASRAAMQIGGPGLWYRPQAPLCRWLAEHVRGHHYDLIVGRYLRTVANCGALDWPPVLLDLDDYDCATQASRLEQPGLSFLRRYSARRQLRRLERVVPSLLGRCAHLWVASREDQELLRSFPTSVLPNIPFAMFGAEPVLPCPPRADSHSILMVGSLRHTANVNAVERFLRVVWPQVHAAVPASEFRIVGYGMTERQQRRWGAIAGVTPVGCVEELGGEYDRCAFTVVPVFEGGGTKIKVLESLYHGRTLVATSHACRGYGDVLKHLDALWVAPDERAFAAGCIHLLRAPALRQEMAARGADLVGRHYSYDRFEQAVCAAVARVAGKHQA